jgi:MFS family permease
MFGFSVVWIGQIFSLLGTSMTGFAMTIWAYEITGQATALALVGFFFVAPMLIAAPFAGALVDRSNRKLMMMLSDIASGIATLVILILYTSGKLEIWHLYITGAFQGVFQSFQWPAYSAAISTMIPKEQYGRANGMLSLAETASNIFAPILAGALLGIIGISGILTIDLITLSIAISALLLVFVPQPKVTVEGKQARGSLLKEAGFGFWYILHRPPLLALQLLFLTGNFMVGVPGAIAAAMILASTGNDPKALAFINSAGAVGGVVGGLVMSAWGGPKRRAYGVIFGWMISSLVGTVLMGLAQSLPVWAAASFMMMFFIPIINGSNQALWQAKVPPDLQGKVFSIRRLIAWFVTPLAMLVAGPLADKYLEPNMQSNTLLSFTFGRVVGTDPGSGMALMFIFGGLAAFAVTVIGYTIPVLRNADKLMPDHDQLPAVEAPQVESAVAANTERIERLQELLEMRQRLLAEPFSQENEKELRSITAQLRMLGRQGA